MIDPRDPNRVLVATDLRGVLVSEDGFAHYASSNQGFSHRVVRAVIVDRKDPNRLYVGVANDKEEGGLFFSDDAGKNWRQSSRGLAGRDVLGLQQADSGALFAGTNHGIFQLASPSASWLPMKMIWGTVPEWQLPQSAAAEPATPEPKPPQRRICHQPAQNYCCESQAPGRAADSPGYRPASAVLAHGRQGLVCGHRRWAIHQR